MGDPSLGSRVSWERSGNQYPIPVAENRHLGGMALIGVMARKVGQRLTRPDLGRPSLRCGATSGSGRYF